MRTSKPLLTGAICLVMAGALPISAVAQDGDVTVVEGLAYAISSQVGVKAELTLDLYLGAEGEDAPMVVYAPGQDESRKSAYLLAMALAEQGVNVVVVDGPRGTPEAAVAEGGVGFRALVEDVACAVRFARGSEYVSETSPLVLSGYSYGGGIASHVALAGEDFASLWEAFGQSGGPPSQLECTFSEASTRVDGFVGVAGAYDMFVGYEGKYGRDFLQEHEPDLWETLWGTVGLHPELRVRLIHGAADSIIPFENSVAFEAVLSEAGYDVELIEFSGGHVVPLDLTVETIMGLVAG